MTAKEQLVNITLDKEVYCYGAGNYGKTVAYSLIDINVDFKGFIVTNKNNVSNYVSYNIVVNGNGVFCEDLINIFIQND